MFFTKLCVYCNLPITFWDRLFGNYYVAGEANTAVAHKKCRVEPKVGD